jgi:hypothetical protein
MSCKMLEKVACNRLSKHLHINNVLVPEQFGFRKGLSIDKAACKLAHTYSNLLTNRHVGEMSCDLAEAVTVN